MKKSELKNYIKENILSMLSEDTAGEIEKTKELTAAVKDLEAAKKEAGIEENELDPLPPLSKNFADLSPEEMRRVGIEYDYEDIGQFYLERSGKEHNLTNNQLGKLGRQITDKLYGGDLGKAYNDVVNSPIDAAAKRLADQGQLSNPRYTDGTSIKEDDDKEPSKSDIKKTKGLAKAKEELALLTREMKSLAKKYSKAEGEEKEKLVKTLKEKTKLKKELESILDKKKI
tara:strand:+ start:273 stop:959 length:687 start_codon:yes stop_codon:yes gene_type:complete